MMVTFLRPAVRFAIGIWPVLTLAPLIVLTWASFQPPGTALGEPNPLDKLYHLAAYACVAGPLGLAWPRKAWIWLGGLLIWSIGIEILQPLVGREGSLEDVVANIFGLILGAGIGWGLRKTLL